MRFNYHLIATALVISAIDTPVVPDGNIRRPFTARRGKNATRQHSAGTRKRRAAKRFARVHGRRMRCGR